MLDAIEKPRCASICLAANSAAHLLDKACKAFDKGRTAILSNMFSMFRKELEVFMKAVQLTSLADRVFLTKKGNHFKGTAGRSPDWSSQREKLFRLQEESQALIHKLISLAAEECPEFSTHIGDAASDTFDRDLTLGLVSFEQEKLYEIEAALKRIDDGSYGICELTGPANPKNATGCYPLGPVLRGGRTIPWRNLPSASRRVAFGAYPARA